MNAESAGTLVAGRYRILATLGVGGFGIVYQAMDQTLDRLVALKIHGSDATTHDANRRALSEAANARLDHPNILRILDYGESDGRLYSVTPFVDGRSLDRILREHGRLEPDAAAEIVVRVGTALTFAHWQGVIHGDIKPGNVMISSDGNVMLTDFGASAGSYPHAPVRVVGTPAYMSPEQATGERVDARSDVFSLGAMFYELLTGRPWFAADGETLGALDIMRRVVEATPRPIAALLHDLPEPMARVVDTALAKDRSTRFQSAADFVNALLPVKATPLGILATPSPPRDTASPARLGGTLWRSLTDRFALPLRAASAAEARAEPGSDHATADFPAYLPQSKDRVFEFAALWDDLSAAARGSKTEFAALAETLTRGLLREAIGYRICDQISYFRGTAGFMVEAPFWWIRQSRFPLLFIAFDSHDGDLLGTVVNQLSAARAAEFFALLVVVPAGRTPAGREADDVRRLVANSVYRLDFVVLDREHLSSIVAHNSANRLIEIIIEQVDDLSVLSPYVVRGPVPGRMFFGREREIKTISQSLRSGDYAVVGGRRIGKTSILHRLKRLLGDDPRYHAIYIDCEAQFTDQDFFAWVREHVGQPTGHTPVSFRTLAMALRDASAPRQVILLLDEIDELLAFDAERRPAGQLFKAMRAASQDGLCRFAFSGSRTLNSHLRDPHSPFFNFCEAMTLGRLDSQSVNEIVRQPMRQLGIHLPDEPAVLRRLVELTSAHPNIAQWLCDRLVRTCAGRTVSLDTVEGVATTDDFYEQYVTTAWGDATPMEKLITLAMAGPSFTWDELLRSLAAYGLHDQGAIRKALDFLLLGSLLDRTADGFHFGLAQFPRIVRQSGIAQVQLDILASEARQQCS